MTIKTGSDLWHFTPPKAETEIETIFFIGNGCIDNGWEPLKEIFHSHDPTFHLMKEGNKARKSLFALCTYFTDPEAFEKIEAKFDIKKHLKILNEVDARRKEIAEIYSECSTNGSTCSGKTFKLNLSNDYLEIMAKESTIVITTNWDQLLWGRKGNGVKHLIQLHGLADPYKFESILFPTELKQEYYFLNFSFGEKLQTHDPSIASSIKKRSESLFSAEKISKILSKSDIIKNLKRIIIAGCALNYYDSELIDLLNDFRIALSAREENLDEVIIVNPNKLVCNRTKEILHGIAKRYIQKFIRDIIDLA